MTAPTTNGTIPDFDTEVSAAVSLAMAGYFSDPDAGNSLTFSASGFPAGTGLSINSSTGEITGTPSAADLVASFDVTVTASDLQNRIRSTTVSFIVSAVPSAAQNYYIDGSSGNDSNAGTDVAPWLTITRANAVSPHASGHVDIWVAPGNYRNQPIVPSVAGTDDTHRKRYRVWGTGVVNVLGPSSGQIIYGARFDVAYISVLRESASSYFLIDGEVVFGTNPGQAQKDGETEPVAKIVRGITVNATGIVLDMDMTRLSGYDGIDIGASADLWVISVNYEQHGIAHHVSGDDWGDMVRVNQSLPVGS